MKAGRAQRSGLCAGAVAEVYARNRNRPQRICLVTQENNSITSTNARTSTIGQRNLKRATKEEKSDEF